MQNGDSDERAAENEAGDAWAEPIDVTRLSDPCQSAAARQHRNLKYEKCFVVDNRCVHVSSLTTVRSVADVQLGDMNVLNVRSIASRCRDSNELQQLTTSQQTIATQVHERTRW